MSGYHLVKMCAMLLQQPEIKYLSHPSQLCHLFFIPLPMCLLNAGKNVKNKF